MLLFRVQLFWIFIFSNLKRQNLPLETCHRTRILQTFLKSLFWIYSLPTSLWGPQEHPTNVLKLLLFLVIEELCILSYLLYSYYLEIIKESKRLMLQRLSGLDNGFSFVRSSAPWTLFLEVKILNHKQSSLLHPVLFMK